MQEYYILQQEEMLVLASLFDMKRIYGIEYEDKRDETRIPYIIHEMARNGVFTLHGDVLFLQEPYRTMFQNVENAQVVLTARKYEKGERYVWFYISENIVRLEESWSDERSVRISMADRNGLFEILEECDFFPEECLDRELAVLEEIEEVRKELEQLPVYVRLQMVPVQQPEKGEGKELKLVRSKHNYWITRQASGEDELLIPYEKEKLYEILRRTMEEMVQ